jgi:phenylacetate-CoA ligase
LITARVARIHGLELPRPLAVITSAETLYDHDKHEIQEAFDTKTFNQYASSDTGAFICDCDHGQLHVNPEFGICEILGSDGKPARPGEEGEIVTTSFCNREQVLIRYRIGDRAVMGPEETCTCGRNMPRIASVTGRIDDILYIPERGFVGRFDPVFKGLAGIYEAQIIQESLGELKVKLVPSASFDDQAESHLLINLRAKVGDAIHIDIERVQEIPRGPNGKFRTVVSQCRDAYPKMVKNQSSLPMAPEKLGD